MRFASPSHVAPALLTLVFSVAAGAAPTFTVFSFTVEPQDAPKVVEAADAFMSSETGQEFPGRLLLQQSVANGTSPATHSFVPIYRSLARQAEFVEKLQDDPAWATFQEEMARISQPVSQVIYRFEWSYGEVSDDDAVWVGHALDVSDPAAFVEAIETFTASEKGQEFPGQVHLASVVAGGTTPVSHLLVVGYASVAEMETWRDGLRGDPAWESYLETSGRASEYLGSTIATTAKTWGEASLSDLTAQ